MIVYAQISGGLGNQLFQYAAGLLLATRWQGQLKLDLTWYSRNRHSPPRLFQLKEFNISAPTHISFGSDSVWRAITNRRKSLRTLCGPLRRWLNVELIEEEHCELLGQELLQRPGRSKKILLRGYWQDCRYAQAVEELLRRELRFLTPPSKPNQQVLSRIMASECPISLHIRRGDYLDLKHRPVLPIGYYSTALKFIEARLGPFELFVFSDDILWARDNLQIERPIIFVDTNSEYAAYDDLRLMASCHHHIIANSSFSWWGAWLNARKDKIVIAPKFWMARKDTYHPNLCPTDWVLLDNFTSEEY